MALGPDMFNATIAVESVFCFQGDDIDDVFSGDSEPYLWVVMIKIDNEGLHQDGNFLVGEAKFFFSPGSHGNIGASMGSGQTKMVPAAVGTWNTSLAPIPISVAGQELTTIPGVILCCAVLMEENLTPDSAMEAGHQALNNLVQTTVANTIASMGLAGLAADAAAELATEAAHGNTISLATAAQRTLTRRLKPIQDLFTVAAPGDLVTTILNNLGLTGFVGTALDRDKPMGVFSQSFAQADLSATFESAPGMPHGERIDINAKMWNMPEWAYTLHGKSWAHHKFVRRDPPAGSRLQVSCTNKRGLMAGQKRVMAIGGMDNGSFWSLGRAEAADLIRSGKKTFFVAQPGSATVDVVAVQGGFSHGQPWYFLQTQADGIPGNNLLDLPDCPAGTDVEVWF